MTVNDTTLNLLNQANLENPGKIGQATLYGQPGEVDGKTIALFSLEEFDPSSMQVALPLGQISNLNELELVRKEIEWLETKDLFYDSVDFSLPCEADQRYIQLNQWYRDWFDSTSEPEEILND
jgi:hypothetical protein